MTRVFLAAGVAALAIAAPAVGDPHGQHGGGGGGGHAAFVARGGGGGGGRMGGRGGFAGPRMERQSFAGPRMGRQSFAGPRMERQSFAGPRMGRQRFSAIERPQRSERIQMRGTSHALRMRAETRMATRGQIRASRVRSQTRMAAREQFRANRAQAMSRREMRTTRVQQAQNLRSQRMQTRMATRGQLGANTGQAQNRMAMRQQLRANQALGTNANPRVAGNNGVGYGVGGCPPGLANKNCTPPGQAAKLGLSGSVPVITAQNAAALRLARVDSLNANLGTRLIAPAVATSLIGASVATAPSLLGMGLSPIPQPISYLYPATPQYYYQYAPGYIYEVDRTTSLIDALIPLLGGGFFPGTYLPQPYMASYVPAFYGLDSFYPASFDYGFGYGNLCNRYAYGVVYQVDCFTGMVENVIPTYAGGYGVGQLLPSAYSFYNVPMQYRSLYYPTADYSYWYAPGAIYQYDPRSSLITSVAALMSPGFTIGQPLPVGYSMYNVPLAYRSTYYDTPTAWYRYNNGYIYEVDPATMVVSSIAASLLG